MFTANQDKAAAELLRVCKPGGKIGLANWTPNGFIGQLFKTLGKHMPPPAGVKSPALWGTRARIDEMFGPQAASIETLPREFMFRYRSAQHWIDVFKTYYGPLLKTFAALDAARAAGPARRHHGADRADEPLGRRHHGGAERISRGDRHQAVRLPTAQRSVVPAATHSSSPPA